MNRLYAWLLIGALSCIACFFMELHLSLESKWHFGDDFELAVHDRALNFMMEKGIFILPQWSRYVILALQIVLFFCSNENRKNAGSMGFNCFLTNALFLITGKMTIFPLLHQALWTCDSLISPSLSTCLYLAFYSSCKPLKCIFPILFIFSSLFSLTASTASIFITTLICSLQFKRFIINKST